MAIYVLESVSLIISLLLLAYGFRTLLFLYTSTRCHNCDSKQKFDLLCAKKSKRIMESKCNNVVTNYKNIIFHDSLRDPKFDCTESRKSFNVLEVRSPQDIESDNFYYPAISIIVATNNEEKVIQSLLESLENLTYDRSRFEVIVVDDSTDSTFEILEVWAKRMENLKIIRKSQRIGSKGGALNLALQNLRYDSSWVIILDADMILPPDTIEKFLQSLSDSKKNCNAIQGYCMPYNNYLYQNKRFANWVSKGTELRLALRNIIEFVARDKLNLPIQITGSLFMIRRSIIQEIGFSTDLCEDWDLTLRLYLREHQGSKLKNDTAKLSAAATTAAATSIIFDENLNAWSQSPTSFWSYFNQRIRVSEGHTRGFIKLIPRLLKSTLPVNKKIEIFLTGFHYLKFVFILCLMIFDIVMATTANSLLDLELNIVLTSLSIQLFCFVSFLTANMYGLIVCNKNNKGRKYDTTILISKMVLDLCTIPALIIGSLRGIMRSKGTFHRTQRIACNIQLSSKNLVSS